MPNHGGPKTGWTDQGGADKGWIHSLKRGSGDLTLLLLHSTGGDETQLLALGREVAPEANLLGVRGRSLEEGVPRYFRRFGAADYDQPQVWGEAEALAAFLAGATEQYGLNPTRTVLLGHGNGAELGLALLLCRPGLLAGAALLRPTLPVDEPLGTPLNGPLTTILNSLPVLLLHGVDDPYAPFGEAIAPLLRKLGADLEDRRLNAGHAITDHDTVILTRWLAPCCATQGANHDQTF
ncbi:alpha/beta hydrolase [Deinococcus sp.]|uniref:alpha/beta hydrolase n=1 Tax=Deinococcus sp. TaxID=47478 RepID=UPI0025BE9800|nr:alpha/beta hydrolase [Deinococcus sp.]